MRRTSLWILALAVIAGACDSDSGVEPDPTPDPLTVRDWRVVPVSGDQVVGAPSVTKAVEPRLVVSAAAIGPDGYSAVPLVAQIELTAEAAMRGMSLASLPPTTLVHWHITDGGGGLYGQTTSPDDSLHVINRWKPSTRAGDYTISAGRLVDGEIVTDATWTVTIEPGPPAQIDVEGAYFVWLGDTLNLAGAAEVTDAHGNPLAAPAWEGVDSTLLYIPSVEGYDTLIVTSGDISREVEVMAIQPLGPGWQYELICRGIEQFKHYDGAPADSVRAVFVVDSVHAPASGARHPNEAAVTAVVHWTGEILIWLAGEGGSSRYGSTYDAPWFDIRPGRIDPGTGRLASRLIANDNPPTQYSGQNTYCESAAEIIETFTAPG